MNLSSTTADWFLTNPDSQLAFLLALLNKSPEQMKESLDTMAKMYAEKGKQDEWAKIAALLPRIAENASILEWWFKLPAGEKLENIIYLREPWANGT